VRLPLHGRQAKVLVNFLPAPYFPDKSPNQTCWQAGGRILRCGLIFIADSLIHWSLPYWRKT